MPDGVRCGDIRQIRPRPGNSTARGFGPRTFAAEAVLLPALSLIAIVFGIATSFVFGNAAFAVAKESIVTAVSLRHARAGTDSGRSRDFATRCAR